MELNVDLLKKTLCINSNYNLKYLNDLYNNFNNYTDSIDSINSNDSKSKNDYSNLTEMLAVLEIEGLKTKRIQTNRGVNPKGKNSNTNQKSNEAPLSKDSCIRYQVEFVKVLVKNMLDFYATEENDSERAMFLHMRNTFPNCDYLDERLSDIPKWITICLTHAEFSYDDSLRILKRIFRNSVYKIIDGNLYNCDSILILSLYGQLIYYMLHQKCSSPQKETLSCMATQLSICLYYRKSMREGFSLVQKGLDNKMPHERALAYHYFAVLAMDLGNLQLAYDIYLSWLQQKNVGNMIQYVSQPKFKVEEELNYRETTQGKDMRTLVFGNLGYVCARISYTYELSSEQEKFFYGLSVDYKKKAIDLRPAYWHSFASYGQVLLEDLHYTINDELQLQEHITVLKKSLGAFDSAITYLPSDSAYASLFAYRLYCSALMELLMFEVYRTKNIKMNNKYLQKYYASLTELVKKYKKVKTNIPSDDDDFRDELRLRNEWLPILSFYGEKNLDDIEKEIHILLLSINQNAAIMKSFLQRREYISTDYQTRVYEKLEARKETRQIAYYTTLKNFKYIFDELYLEDNTTLPKIDKNKEKENTKNCLTVMNAKYMNDPNEGVVLLAELTRNLAGNNLFSGKSAVEFNRSIFNKCLVFLKSFTEQIDKLTMWNRYANDYEGEGRNSNGCCVFVSPECFVNNVKYSFSGRELVDSNKDDFRLYRVVYLSSNGDISKDRNPGLNGNVYLLYENLQRLMEQLNDCLKIYAKIHPKKIDKLSEIVERSLSESLRKIIFLFKYDDYSDEQESRLILFRDNDHQEDIRLIDGDFPKLAINPFFQIFVKGIMFGPNVRNPEKWEPYFQYQLNEMWKKDSSSSEKEDPSKKKFFIKQSSIKYLT